jgi:hypothetical protein
MSKIVIFSLMLMWCTILIAQPCTPNPGLPNGIFPSTLAEAELNVPYQQVIQFKSPRDTTAYVPDLGISLDIEIDSIRILDVLGLPPGMVYACHNNSCMINGGEAGCLLISGTCVEPGGYPLRVIIKTRAKAILGVTKIPQDQIDTNTRYGIMVNWATGLMDIVENGPIKIYPNPTTDFLILESGMNAPLTSITITDILGKEVLSQSYSNDDYKQQVSVAQLKNGIYSVYIKAGDEVYTKRFLKE